MITVVGDIIVDEYHFGVLVGSNPEVSGGRKIRIVRSELKLGGAAAVAAMVVAHGERPLLASVVSDDQKGSWVIAELHARNARTEICRDPQRITSVKTRILIDHRIQPDRLDFETVVAITDEHVQRISKAHLGDEEGDALILVDYGKGVLTDSLIQKLIQRATNKGIPIIVDPAMGAPWSRYKGATLIKANMVEAIAELGQSCPPRTMAAMLSDKHNCKIIITDDGRGMVWADGGVTGHVLAHNVPVVDTTGCGDTVVVAVAMNIHKSLVEICELAAAEAAKCVGRLGVC